MGTSNLPAFPTPFVGRHNELAEISQLLADPACRLLTLVGPGGIGKTRLALQAASQVAAYPDGIYFVALQPLTSSEFIIPTLASAINLQFYPGGDPRQQILDYLREKAMLLVIDNCEHLLDEVDIISAILAAAAGVKVLATSRERLNLVEEWVFEVQGLAVPPNERSGEIETYSAVQLFVQNARRVNVGFSLTASQQWAVARICRMVGGMPLGIELASAWVRALSCEQIAGELERSLDILETPARNVPPRHRNMRAAIEPTWQRLSEGEREVFKKLSVFRGGFTPEAGQAVAGASLRILSSLVDKSLLRANADGRYDLHELLRQYAEEQLNTSKEESEAIHNLHCAYFAEFVQQQWEEIIGPHMNKALKAVEKQLENVQKGWSWAVQYAKYDELSKSLFALWQFYYFRNRFQDAEIAFAQAIDGLENAENANRQDELLGCLLASHAVFCLYLGLQEKSQVSFQKCIPILASLNDTQIHSQTPFALANLSYVIHETQPQEAILLCQKAITICRGRGYRFELMFALSILENIYLFVLGNHIEGKPVVKEGIEIARQIGNSWFTALFQLGLAVAAYGEGDFVQAKPLLEAAYIAFRDFDDRQSTSGPLLMLGDIARLQGDYKDTRRWYHEGLTNFKQMGLRPRMLMLLAGIMDLLAAEGEQEMAVELSAFILSQPRNSQFDPKGRATLLFQRLETTLPTEVFNAAVERGKARKLDETVNELLAELSQPDEEALRLDRKTLTQPLLDPLTERELKVLQLVSSGFSNVEIAERLMVEVSTVKKHLNHIYGKLGVETRTQALLRAQALNLL